VSRFRTAEAKGVVIPPGEPAFVQPMLIAYEEAEDAFVFVAKGDSEIAGYAIKIPANAISAAKTGVSTDKLRVS
jgi:hypothetical protein